MSTAAAAVHDAPQWDAWCCPACRGALTRHARVAGAGNAGDESAGAGDAGAGDECTCAACVATYAVRSGRPQFAPGHQPAGFSAERREHLAALAEDHFWFPPRDRLLSEWLDRALHPPAVAPLDPPQMEPPTSLPTTPAAAGGTALEVGCGPGRFLAPLARRFRRVLAVDAYDRSLQDAAGRLDREGHQGGEIALAQADLHRLPVADASSDLVAALDVLEHLDDEAAALGEMRRVTRPGGHLLLSVPAFPVLWSALDTAAGHRRRYRQRSLRRLLRGAGWEPQHHTHYQALLFPLLAVSRRLGAGRDGGTSPASGPGPLERRPPAWLGRLLGAVNHLEVSLFSRHTLPFGSSLILLARRPG